MTSSQPNTEEDVAAKELERVMGLTYFDAVDDLVDLSNKIIVIRDRTIVRIENLAKVVLYMEQKPAETPSEAASTSQMTDISKKNSAKEEDKKQLLALTSLDGKTIGNRHRELLALCKRILQPYGIPIYEFSQSWNDGHAFCALIHSFRSDLIDEKYFKCKDPIETLEYVEEKINSLGIFFEGNFVKHMQRKRPNFIRTFLFILRLYNYLKVEHDKYLT